MKTSILFALMSLFMVFQVFAQTKTLYSIPEMPNPAVRMATIEREWAALQQSPPQIGVRDGFMFLLDALDTRHLSPKQIEWTLKLLQTRVITDQNANSYGNIYWGWSETGGDMGDGNNVQFCVQYGILIKILFNDRLSPEAKKTLDTIFNYASIGVRDQKVRISYTNIFLMKIWNLVALGQVYNQPSFQEDGRKYLNIWLNHIANWGNREYDSPTYCGVDLESLLLIHRYIADKDIKNKAADAINFLMTDLCAHYNERAGILGGAHSRDYNRVFSRDLLEEKYMNPLLGSKNNIDHLFHQICFTELKEIGLTSQQKELMNRKNRLIVQRWDSVPNAFACDFVGNKFSIATSNQAYSPDDKPFVIYLSSNSIPTMPNIAYVIEGRDDHYGTWGYEGKGEKMKHLMPANYPSNGGWGKTRHLMPFMQSAQNKGEFVMLVSGVKDHNCINDYLNSTIILPNTFDELWIGKSKINVPNNGEKAVFDENNTLFARFEDVAIAFRILWDDADKGEKMVLYNDGYKYEPRREKFQLKHNEVLRLTLKHPNNGKANIAMWWKVEEGINNKANFNKFREKVLKTPLSVIEKDGTIDISVATPSGKLGVKADIINKLRLQYYNPSPVSKDFLFNVDGTELGQPILNKYKKQIL